MLVVEVSEEGGESLEALPGPRFRRLLGLTTYVSNAYLR